MNVPQRVFWVILVQRSNINHDCDRIENCDWLFVRNVDFALAQAPTSSFRLSASWTLQIGSVLDVGDFKLKWNQIVFNTFLQSRYLCLVLLPLNYSELVLSNFLELPSQLRVLLNLCIC